MTCLDMFENRIKTHQKHYDVSGHFWELYQIIAQCCAIHDIINSCDTNRYYQCIFKTWKNHKGFVNIPKPKENFCISPRLSIFNNYRSFRSIISVKNLMSLWALKASKNFRVKSLEHLRAVLASIHLSLVAKESTYSKQMKIMDF